MPEQVQKPKQNSGPDYRKESQIVLGIVFEMGFIIALPLLLFAELGKWLDYKTGKNYFLYLGIVLALMLTVIWLYQRFSEMVTKLRSAAKSVKSKDDNKQKGKM